MIKIEVKNLAGEKVEELNVSEEVFGLELNEDLLHQVYVSQAANKRVAIAHAKTISERRGSTKKPWKQKGTGRARTGSVRNSIWRKGGVVFGPTSERNFEKKINKKMNRLATMVALSGKISDGQLIVVDSLKLDEVKSKRAQEVIKKLEVKGTALVAFDKEEKVAMRAFRNIPKVDNLNADQINVYDMLNHKYLILSKESVMQLEKKFTGEKA